MCNNVAKNEDLVGHLPVNENRDKMFAIIEENQRVKWTVSSYELRKVA